MQRKTLKAEARKTLKRHYWLLVIVCLFAAFLSADYGSSPAALNTNMNPNAASQEASRTGESNTGASDSFGLLLQMASGTQTEHATESGTMNGPSPIRIPSQRSGGHAACCPQ